MKKQKPNKNRKHNQAQAQVREATPFELFWQQFGNDLGLRSTRLGEDGNLIVTVNDAAAAERMPAAIGNMPLKIVVAPI